MTIVVNDLVIKFPEKLKNRQEEIIEFSQELRCNKNHYVKVWEDKRHELCGVVCRKPNPQLREEIRIKECGCDKVLDFIKHFHSIDPNNDITTTFTCGCCYWFAYILCSRFDGEMMYDPIMNHFCAWIGEHAYDVTGDVTDKYQLTLWQTFADILEKQRIQDYCINFTRK